MWRVELYLQSSVVRRSIQARDFKKLTKLIRKAGSIQEPLQLIGQSRILHKTKNIIEHPLHNPMIQQLCSQGLLQICCITGVYRRSLRYNYLQSIFEETHITLNFPSGTIFELN